MQMNGSNQELKPYKSFNPLLRNRKSKQQLDSIYEQDLKPALFNTAVEYRHTHCYHKKIGKQYVELSFTDSPEELKVFGLGPYFYIEFMRRIVWLYAFMMVLELARVIICWQSDGLSEYTISFTTFIFKASIGNYSKKVITDYDSYFLGLIPFVNFLVFFLLFLVWKAHFFSQIRQSEQDNKSINPSKVCVQVESIDESALDQDQLQKIALKFGPVYQISLVRRFKDKLSYFEDLDNLQRKIKERELEVILGSGDQEHVEILRRERDELKKYISTLRIQPQIISAYIHYQFQKSKINMVNKYSKECYTSSFLDTAIRNVCCCCLSEFKSPILIKQINVPEPEEINWQSRQIDDSSKCLRVACVVFVIILFLVISCTIIGLCSAYISINSVNCEGKDISIAQNVTYAKENSNEIQKKCFCAKNIISALSNKQIADYCGDEMYIEQGIQFVIIITSGIVNIVFGFIVDKLINVTRPISHSNALITKTTIYTLFLILNTAIVPLLLYANIFGFKATKYVSLITLISSDLQNFFNVQNIQLYNTFDRVWYRNVSPIFTNYIIADIIITILFIGFHFCTNDYTYLKEKQKTTIQKVMNQQITNFQIKIYKEYSYINLIIFLTIFYSGGIPALIPLGFINIFFKYVYNKCVLQSDSTRVPGLTINFVGITFTFIPIFLIFSILFSAWMIIANQEILTTLKVTAINLNIGFEALQNILQIPFYFILAAVIAFYFLLYNTLIRFCIFVGEMCNEGKKVVHPQHSISFQQNIKNLHCTYSYNIRNNKQLKNVMTSLERFLVKDQK